MGEEEDDICATCSFIIMTLGGKYMKEIILVKREVTLPHCGRRYIRGVHEEDEEEQSFVYLRVCYSI